MSQPEIIGSATLIQTYMECPSKAFARLSKQESKKGIPLVLGSAIHTVLEQYALTKGQTATSESFDKEMKKGCEENGLPTAGPEWEKAVLKGLTCIKHGVYILSSPIENGKRQLFDALESDLVERPFNFTRNGFSYRGKIDFIRILKNGKYVVADWKSSAQPKSTSELFSDIQFTIYPYAGYMDPDPRLNGKLPESSLFIHLLGQANEYCKPDKNGNQKRKSVKDVELDKVTFEHHTQRTMKDIDRQFKSSIEPAMQAMKDGLWYRNLGACFGKYGVCEYFRGDKKSDRPGFCGVELPCEGTKYKIRQSAMKSVQQLPDQQSLINLDDVPTGKLKPYYEEDDADTD